MSEVTRNDASPFEAIKLTRPDGSEFWSARDLMPLLGYGADWRNFKAAIDRAVATHENTVGPADAAFAQVTQLVGANNLGDQTRRDVEMTRFACYLVAMNGDPRKRAVAAAQAYFAIKTREAETAPAPRAIPATYAEALRAAADAAEQAEVAEQARAIAEAKVVEDAPKVELAEHYLAAKPNGRLVREVAKQLDLKEKHLRGFLIEERLIFSRQLLCGGIGYDFYAQHSPHFETRDTTVTHSWGGCQHGTLFITPRGVELIRRRLTERRSAVNGADR